MIYERTRLLRIGLACLVAALACLVAVVPLRAQPMSALAALALGGGLAALAACCATLRVRDEGDHLWVGYGPFPLVCTRVPYARVEGVAFGRGPAPRWPRLSGWHWGPGPGWVELRLGRRRLRIGSDDPAGLAAVVGRRTWGRRPRGGAARRGPEAAFSTPDPASRAPGR